MASLDQVSDLDLAARMRGGDNEALRTLYDRYFDRLYDLAARTVRDADLAADIAQTTFVKAWETLRRGTPPANVKAWLFTVARNAAIDELRRRTRTIPLAPDEEDTLHYAALDHSRFGQPEGAAEDQELIDLVWEAAAGLSPRDYSLLDLHLRQGLGPDELAETLHVRRSNVYTMLSRLKDALEEVVSYTLLIRRGRRDCPELNDILAAHPLAQLTPATRRAIRHHLERCEACRERKRRFAAPVEVFSGLALVPASAQQRDAIWQGIATHLQDAGAPGAVREAPRSRTDPVKALGDARAWLTAAIVAAAAIAVAIPVLSTARGGSAVQDPPDVRSVSHEPGQPSTASVVVVAWSRPPDARAYAIGWSQAERDLPEARADLPGDATTTSSSPLDPGSWYFHLRTQGASGAWTSTVHIGPFVITPLSPTASPGLSIPTATPEPSPAAPRAEPTGAAPSPAESPPANVTTPSPAAPASPSPTAPVPEPERASEPAFPSMTAPAESAATATLTAAPPTPPTATPPPTSPTPTPNVSSTRTATSTFTLTPCPPLAAATLDATTGATNQVTVTWKSNGGCAPFKGSITAQYQGDPRPYQTYPISTPSGSLTDSPPTRCPGAFTLVYTLSLQDSTGQTATASATTRITWPC